jgi:DNA-binding NarL/FixJ family response regulator
VRIFLVFRDTIYASGLQATLSAAPGVEAVAYAGSIASAWEDEALTEADVVLLDGDLGGADSFVQEVTIEGGARIVMCIEEVTAGQVLEAIGNGAAGALARDRLTPDTLIAAVSAVAAGIYALDAGALRALTASVSPTSHRDRDRLARATGQFTAREQLVLRLVAAGLSNREIAQQLSYSERTIKAVLHDIVTKLGVKSRSQAVALAVRERMI